MGSTESRIEQGPAAPEPVQGGDTKVSLTMSSRLSSSLGGQQELQRTGGHSQAELEAAYLQGARDRQAEIEEQQQHVQHSLVASNEQAAAEASAREERAAQQLQSVIDDISRRQFRQPQQPVQCAAERSACMQCYRDGDAASPTCVEAVKAFEKCGKAVAGTFVKPK